MYNMRLENELNWWTFHTFKEERKRVKIDLKDNIANVLRYYSSSRNISEFKSIVYYKPMKHINEGNRKSKI